MDETVPSFVELEQKKEESEYVNSSLPYFVTVEQKHDVSKNVDTDEKEETKNDEEPDEHKEYVIMPSSIWNMRIFMKTSLNLNNIRNTD